jgi:hypothetical protein
MAKQGKLLPARRQRHEPEDAESVLLRSAESIGRVIGSLQRQLDGARNRISELADTPTGSPRANSNGGGKTAKASRVKAKPAATASRKKAAKAPRKSAHNGRSRSSR